MPARLARQPRARPPPEGFHRDESGQDLATRRATTTALRGYRRDRAGTPAKASAQLARRPRARPPPEGFHRDESGQDLATRRATTTALRGYRRDRA
ncbi:hypothetical protein, partial [Streptomyces sp. NPDC058373]|uniref:hypothetical protein n=1 Tax=Streptomyces sp. NPDC058373 TaxID=3346465 RepID=UPI0036490031